MQKYGIAPIFSPFVSKSLSQLMKSIFIFFSIFFSVSFAQWISVGLPPHCLDRDSLTLA